MINKHKQLVKKKILIGLSSIHFMPFLTNIYFHSQKFIIFKIQNQKKKYFKLVMVNKTNK